LALPKFDPSTATLNYQDLRPKTQDLRTIYIN
jgi:hypothetical protein